MMQAFLFLPLLKQVFCYFWHGRNIGELNNTRPSKISLLYDGQISRRRNASLPSIFSATFHSVAGDAYGFITVAYGSIVKPTFEKLQVQLKMVVNLRYAEDGVLLPKHQAFNTQKDHVGHAEATTMGRENAGDATFPIPKTYDFQSRKRKYSVPQSTMVDNKTQGKDASMKNEAEDNMEIEDDGATLCMGERLKSLGILVNKNCFTDGNCQLTRLSALNSKSYSDAESLSQANLPSKKLSGRLQLIMAQIGRAGQTETEMLPNGSLVDESEDEDEVDEYIYTGRNWVIPIVTVPRSSFKLRFH